MDNLSSIIIGIVTSFIASIIFLFTSSFIKRKSKQLLDWVYARNTKFSNKFYSSISKNKSGSAEFITAFSILFLLSTALTITSIKLTDKYKIHEKIVAQIQNDKDFNYDKYTSLYDLYEKQQNSEDKQFVIEHFWIYSFLRYFLLIFTLIFTSLGYFKIFRGYQIRETNKEFNRHLDIISPYLSSNEILLLKSNWARMKSREDYTKIATEINNYISEINSKKMKTTS